MEVLLENFKDGLTVDEIVASYPSLSKADLIPCLKGTCTSPNAVG